jgi:hypothetical protein
MTDQPTSDTTATHDTATTEPEPSETAETSETARADDGSNGSSGSSGSSDGVVERGELVPRAADGTDGRPEEPTGSITEPAKVMRIGSMVKQLLEEVRHAPLDEASRERLAEIYERSVVELSEALSPDLQEELRMLALPFDDDEIPSDAELRIAKAQLVGWLEGLFHGIQASLVAQQMAARQQLEQMRQLGPGQGDGEHGQRPGFPPQPDRPGTYI